jgi:hypothetical protein
MTTNFVQTALFEQRFWFQVLGDHGRFIRDSLGPSEAEEIRSAKRFVTIFDGLLNQVQETVNTSMLSDITTQGLSAAMKLRGFKLHLLRRHLQSEIVIHLPPTFLNHMVNEVDECIRVMTCLQAGKNPDAVHVVHQHLLWLPDAAGHAATLTGSVDLVEKQLAEKSNLFTKHFEQFYLKAIELAGYLRANIRDFPALKRFNHDVNLEMVLFRAFLHELEEMELKNSLLGTLTPLMPDHMAREECYYLYKLSELADEPTPACDPASPRRVDPRIPSDSV